MKTALITGGAHSQGIGYASALAFLEAGYQVVVTGISEEEVRATPPRNHLSSRVLDVRDDRAVKSLLSEFDRLDALVNCAGMSGRDEFEPEGFARTVDVNLTGTMRVCMAARTALAAARGAIVNIGSIYSTFGSDVVPGYSASKGGVVQLTNSLARIFAPQGIRVNTVAPGWIKTGMSRPLWEDEAAAATIAARTPMGRWGKPDELADVIVFLCSEKARFVTGVLIPVDGGYSISG